MHRGVLAGTRLAEAARQAERGGGGGRWSEAVGAGRGRVLAVAGAVWGAVEGGYRLWLSRQAPLVARCARSRRCGAGAVQGGRDKKERQLVIDRVAKATVVSAKGRWLRGDGPGTQRGRRRHRVRASVGASVEARVVLRNCNVSASTVLAPYCARRASAGYYFRR